MIRLPEPTEESAMKQCTECEAYSVWDATHRFWCCVGRFLSQKCSYWLSALAAAYIVRLHVLQVLLRTVVRTVEFCGCGRWQCAGACSCAHLLLEHHHNADSEPGILLLADLNDPFVQPKLKIDLHEVCVSRRSNLDNFSCKWDLCEPQASPCMTFQAAVGHGTIHFLPVTTNVGRSTAV
ncbi:hypothetical protein BC835DRAFT_648903 [Cytidiella melzeri]|nr:hypothetical protein BC835DRAFT_648903 [Cytidiella melzeri]